MQSYNAGLGLIDNRGDDMSAKKETINEKLLARAREMRDLLQEVAGSLKGARRTRVAEALAKANRDIPKSNKIGKQIVYEYETVLAAVDRCGGDKNAAAQKLGCSLRSIYTVLARGPAK